jgi:mRNA-degrading endonuclease toxin of MazEF toxin-antitoxin module
MNRPSSGAPEIKQGDIYWVDIPPAHTVGSEQYDRRPYIIVSRTAVNRSGKTVVGVPLTTAIQSLDPAGSSPIDPPYRIRIPAKEIIKDVSFGGETKNSIAKTDHIRVLDKARLQNKMGVLTSTASAAVGLGLANLFDLR